MSAYPMWQGCTVPPPGWWCSREPGHRGPCAAREVPAHRGHVPANMIPDWPPLEDGEVSWRSAAGRTRTYRGPVIDLGVGIPRRAHHRSWGIRRAVFDAAFGYVSGFPVRDIIPYAIRALFPTRILDAPVAFTPEDDVA